jgi:hypothetical protein
MASDQAFICNQESKYLVGILAPSPGTFKNWQESIPLAIQKSEYGYDPSDLLQRWENEGEYIFSEIPGEQQDLIYYLKDRESEGVKSVRFYFPNDWMWGQLQPTTRPSTTFNSEKETRLLIGWLAVFRSRCDVVSARLQHRHQLLVGR